jgi:hypothetical protein
MGAFAAFQTLNTDNGSHIQNSVRDAISLLVDIALTNLDYLAILCASPHHMVTRQISSMIFATALPTCLQ